MPCVGAATAVAVETGTGDTIWTAAEGRLALAHAACCSCRCRPGGSMPAAAASHMARSSGVRVPSLGSMPSVTYRAPALRTRFSSRDQVQRRSAGSHCRDLGVRRGTCRIRFVAVFRYPGHCQPDLQDRSRVRIGSDAKTIPASVPIAPFRSAATRRTAGFSRAWQTHLREMRRDLLGIGWKGDASEPEFRRVAQD